MTIQEKKTIVNIFSSILIFGCYFIYVFQTNQQEELLTTTDLSIWGKIILIMIPISIIARIIIHIVFAIIHKIFTNEDTAGREDERDKMIELRSSRASQITFGIGFVLSMVPLVMGYPPASMFITILVFGLMSEVISESLKFYYYRRGF